MELTAITADVGEHRCDRTATFRSPVTPTDTERISHRLLPAAPGHAIRSNILSIAPAALILVIVRAFDGQGGKARYVDVIAGLELDSSPTSTSYNNPRRQPLVRFRSPQSYYWK